MSELQIQDWSEPYPLSKEVREIIEVFVKERLIKPLLAGFKVKSNAQIARDKFSPGYSHRREVKLVYR